MSSEDVSELHLCSENIYENRLLRQQIESFQKEINSLKGVEEAIRIVNTDISSPPSPDLSPSSKPPKFSNDELQFKNMRTQDKFFMLAGTF